MAFYPNFIFHSTIPNVRKGAGTSVSTTDNAVIHAHSLYLVLNLIITFLQSTY